MTPILTLAAKSTSINAVEKQSPRIPVLSIVIVNYRSWRYANRLMQSLLAVPEVHAGQVEITLIDNAAVRSAARVSLRKQPGVSVRAFRQNRGFARGVNEGCRLSRGEWCLILNPDTTIPSDFVSSALALIAQWSQMPKAGIVGIRLCDGDDAVQGSSGPPPTLRRSVLGLMRPRSRRRCQPIRANQPVEAPWVTGCGMLIRRECLDSIGGFDPGFFLYYEDADLCIRARAAGWTVWHDPRLAVQHHRPLHSRRVPAWLRLLTRHALLRFAFKHWPQWEFQAICGLVAIEARARALRAKLDHRTSAARIFRLQQRVTADCRAGRWEEAFRKVWKVAQRRGRRHERPTKPR
jgi:GT2 family glycosyltransferase